MTDLPIFASATEKGLFLKVLVQPKGSVQKIVGIHGDSLKVLLNTPPVDGAANDSLLSYLKKAWSLGPKELELVSGHKSRSKVLLLKPTGVVDFHAWWSAFSRS